MNILSKIIGGLTLAILMALSAGQNAMAAETNTPVMRIFEFVLAPSDVQRILEVGRKNIETSIREEPGVLSMFSATNKDDPTKLYVVEVYRDQTGYQAHAESAHFKAFLAAIQSKVISRRVTETAPTVLGAKAFTWPTN
jgi:quinol monooxygenase YgiN